MLLSDYSLSLSILFGHFFSCDNAVVTPAYAGTKPALHINKYGRILLRRSLDQSVALLLSCMLRTRCYLGQDATDAAVLILIESVAAHC